MAILEDAETRINPITAVQTTAKAPELFDGLYGGAPIVAGDVNCFIRADGSVTLLD